MRTSFTFPRISRGPSWNTREFCTAMGTAVKKFLMKLGTRFCLNLFSQREGKSLVDHMASCWIANWESTFSALLNCCNQIWKSELELILYMISDDPKVSLGNVARPLYAHRIALKDDFCKKEEIRLRILLWSTKFWKLWQRLSVFLPDKNSSFKKKNIFNNAPVRRIATAMNTNSAFTGSYTENPFRYQQINLRQIRTFRGGQPIVDFDAVDNFCLYVTTMKAMNFQDDILSFLIEQKNHCVLVFDLISMQDAAEKCH